MFKSIDKNKSFSTHQYRSWDELNMLFDNNAHIVIDKIAKLGVVIPEYLHTVLKKSDWNEKILMSWPSKNTLICQQDTAEGILAVFKKKGWYAYRINEIDYNEMKKILE